MTQNKGPVFRIWISGIPKSYRSKGTKTKYIQEIQEATKKEVPHPIKSGRIDIEIFFVAPRSMRADVDNIIKPILDALVNIIYFDDKQVRSIRAVAIPPDDIMSFHHANTAAMDRLYKAKAFLIDIYHGIGIDGPRGNPSGIN